MLTRILSVLGMLAFATTAIAGGWASYSNGRYGYRIDIPPGFFAVVEAGNGDGGVARFADGASELRVWGGYILDGKFSDEIASRIDQDRADGWNVSYEKRQQAWAVWSGSRAGRIFYQRAVTLCDDAVGYFRLEYAGSDSADMEPLIGRLGKSLRKNGC